MSLTYSISVNATEVLADMEQHSAYVGKKSKDDETDYDRIATVVEDKDELQSLWNDAANIVLEECRPFLATDTSVAGQTISMQLSMPDRTAATQEEIKEHIKAYMTFALLKRWFMITNRDDVERYEAEAGQRRERIHSALYGRKPQAAVMTEDAKKWINF